MGLKKCPRCELNYIPEHETYCNVCNREIKGETDADDSAAICLECGDNPSVKGSDLCAACLREVIRQEKLVKLSDEADEPAPIDLNEVELDDIDVPVAHDDDDIPANELVEIVSELGDDGAEEEEEEEFLEEEEEEEDFFDGDEEVLSYDFDDDDEFDDEDEE